MDRGEASAEKIAEGSAIGEEACKLIWPRERGLHAQDAGTRLGTIQRNCDRPTRLHEGSCHGGVLGPLEPSRRCLLTVGSAHRPEPPAGGESLKLSSVRNFCGFGCRNCHCSCESRVWGLQVDFAANCQTHHGDSASALKLSSVRNFCGFG